VVGLGVVLVPIVVDLSLVVVYRYATVEIRVSNHENNVMMAILLDEMVVV